MAINPSFNHMAGFEGYLCTCVTYAERSCTRTLWFGGFSLVLRTEKKSTKIVVNNIHPNNINAQHDHYICPFCNGQMVVPIPFDELNNE